MSLQRGAIAFIVDLTSKPELNGIRVRLKEFIEDRQRWRAYRVDSLSAEPLGVKADNLVVESPGKLPPLLSSAAATADKQNLVLAWLNSGGDIDAILRGSPKETGANLLMAACERGDADFAAELLRRGADVNARDDFGSTALMFALQHAAIVELLLDAGAHTHLRRRDTAGTALEGGTALENAVRLGLDEVASLLRAHDEKEPMDVGDEPAKDPDVEVEFEPRDTFEMEREVLMKLLAADVLEKSLASGVDMEDYRLDERDRWYQRVILTAFADPADANSLSKRFAKHGEKRLDMKVWRAESQRQADFLARLPRFRVIAAEVTDEMPGSEERLSALAASASREAGVKIIDTKKTNKRDGVGGWVSSDSEDDE